MGRLRVDHAMILDAVLGASTMPDAETVAAFRSLGIIETAGNQWNDWDTWNRAKLAAVPIEALGSLYVHLRERRGDPL